LENRHHALRLRFVPYPNDPEGVRQIVAPPGGLRPLCLDLDINAADSFIASEINRPFDLATETPARAVLIRLSTKGDHHRLLLLIHHAVCDGWSVPILLSDLAVFYRAAVAGHVAILPDLPCQFEDVATWQRHHLDSPEGQAMQRRWVERLTPPPEPLLLPQDRSRPAVRRFAGGWRQWDFDATTTATLRQAADRTDTTIFGVFAALLQVLLYRHSGHTDIALGLLVSGREHPALAGLVGFFVNTVVLRQNLDPTTPFSTHLTATRDTLLAAMADQDTPLEDILRVLPLSRDGDRNPLFDVLATWQDDAPTMPEIPGLILTPTESPFPFAKFDLSFHFQRIGDGLRLVVEYDTDLFDAETVDALCARLTQLATALPDDMPLSEMPILPENEAAFLAACNATDCTLPTARTLPMPLLDCARSTPYATAVVSSEGTLSYATFVCMAGGLAKRLIKAGVKPGDVVVVAMRRSPAMVATIHGILMAGAAYCPIDPDLPAPRRDAMQEDLGDPWIVADADAADLFPSHRRIAADGDSAAPPPPPADPDELAYVLFTSGSTGRPKGVEISHRAVLNRILWMQETFPIGPGDVILQKTPAGFDVSVWELFWWSWTGAAVAVPPPGIEKNPQALAEAIAHHRVTVIHFVPSMLRALLTMLEQGQIEASLLASLRYVFSSGEALDVATVRLFNHLLHDRFGTTLHNLYGPTEATVDVTWHPCSPWGEDSVVPIGRPIANTRVHILDAQMHPVPPGATGEIVLSGMQVTRGYRNRPDLTAKHVLPDPETAGGRRYRTGDLGRWRRDGTVEYLGRKDQQVKVRGVRIEPAEIEATLDAYPDVERGLISAITRHDTTELDAFVLGASSLTTTALRAHLRAHLPEAMIPTRFFRITEIPLTTSGKVDRKALNGTPLDSPSRTEIGPAEAELATLWRALLPEGADFGTEDGFFDVGGNSLLLLRLHERIEARWPGAFRVADLFSYATIAAQSRHLSGLTPHWHDLPPSSATSDGAVAIIGMAARVAGADDLDTLWQDMAAGTDRIAPLSPQRAAIARALFAASGTPNPSDFREAAYIDDALTFDPRRFRIAPADAALIDPEHRLFMETALAAIEDAGLGGHALKQAHVGVYAGGTPNMIWRTALSRIEESRAEQAFALNVPSNIATRLGFLNDWHGPAVVLDTACSSGLAAVLTACRDLASGTAEIAIAGAAKLLLAPPGAQARMTIESTTARTHAFDASADGTGIGEGATVFVLKSLSRA
ncbi:MAG: amino acid adenylation domain-containing protein, partial [Rhodospirillaceae bacterium]|nr:amino acid adenylation domain-containing protein [Rhodospirillaceae bacterium]